MSARTAPAARAPSHGWLSELFVSFQGEGLRAGRRHLFVRLAGCNLRCRYCDTPASLVRTQGCSVDIVDERHESVPNPISAVQVAAWMDAAIAAVPGLDSVAVTGGEPLVQADFLAAVLERSTASGRVMLETNGMYPERLAVVLPHLRTVSMDWKLPSNSGERGFWDEHREFLRVAVAAGVEIYVKAPIDAETDEGEVMRMAETIGTVAPGVPLFLTPIMHEDRLAIGPADLDRFHDAVCHWVDDVRVMPQAHKLLGIR